MNWFTFLIGSSVGKKMLMAATGLCLIAFLSVHLIGNLTAFAGAEEFNAYAAKLHSLEPLLTIFNIGLVTLGLIHIVVGIILFFENLKARPTGYKMYRNPGGRTVGSNTMPYTGVLILAFVIFHLFKFTFVDKSVTPTKFHAAVCSPREVALARVSCRAVVRLVKAAGGNQADAPGGLGQHAH